MLKTYLGIGFLTSLSLFSCKTAKPVKTQEKTVEVTKSETPVKGEFEQLLETDARLKSFLDRRDSLQIQVIYTRIDRDKHNRPRFTDYFYHVDPERYFYPASTVKLPTALMALEKLHQLNIPGLDAEATMISEYSYGKQTAVFNDPTAPDGRPSLRHYLKKVFLVSDNDAQNRLYEFLGQAYLNDNLHRKGYPEAQIIHRLDISLTEEENRHTNSVRFLDTLGHVMYSQPAQYNPGPFPARSDSIGKGFISNGQLHAGAMDFSKKNRIGLYSLHKVLRSVMFPEDVDPAQRFSIPEKDLQWVRKYLSQYPGESAYPAYGAPEFYPAYCKFLLYGAERNAAIRPQMRIFNKVGDAYGYLLDVAYVADFENKVEFMLSAVIYCNSDGILNDDKYDYEQTGYPFMKYLGEFIYKQELGRKKEHLPDLSEFRYDYTEK